MAVSDTCVCDGLICAVNIKWLSSRVPTTCYYVPLALPPGSQVVFVCLLFIRVNFGEKGFRYFINAFTRCSFVFIRICILISSCIRVFIRLFACSFIYFAILSGFTKRRKGKADEVFCFGIETFVNFCGCFICTEEHIE